MPTEKINYEDVLKDGTDKLNKSIENANQAEIKSEEAKQTSNMALSTAGTAEQKADSVQTQFNQVVIEGDSSVEAAQARVDANGNSYDTLRDRLNSSDEQLAETRKYSFDGVSRSRFYNYLVTSEKVTFIGDSVTELEWYSPLSKYTNATLINKGVGADTTVKVLDRFDDILSSNADLYVVAIGTNDVRYRDPLICAMTSAEYVENCGQMVTRILTHNPNAGIVFINAWCAFDKDYGSELDTVERDSLLNDYNIALNKYCSTENIPFINANDNIKKVVDYSNRPQFLIDAIHPNQKKGVELYSKATLFGNEKVEDYDVSPTKTNANYLYRLKIYNYCDLDSIMLYNEIGNRIVPTSYWGNVNNYGHDDINSLFSTQSYSYRPRNENDIPIIIIFSTYEPIYAVQQTGVGTFPANIMTDFDLYYTRDKSRILDFYSDQWNLIKSYRNYGKREIIFDKNLTDSISFTADWGFRTSNSRKIVVKNDVLYINCTFKKSSPWTGVDVIATIPAIYLEGQSTLVGRSFSDTGGSVSSVNVLIETSGNVSVGWRSNNADGADCVNVNAVIPLV